jgi:hypothetical protein
MEQKRHVVTRHIHVALVDFGGPRHRVEVLDLRAIGIVDDLAVLLVADAKDFVEGFALSKLDNGVIELAAADEVEHGTLVESLVRRGGDRRSDECNANRWIRSLDCLSQPLITFPAHSRGEEDEELVVLTDPDGLVGGDVVRWRIEQARSFKEACGIGEPDGVPVGFNLPCCGPARTCAAIEVFKRRGIEEEGFQRHGHSFSF